MAISELEAISWMKNWPEKRIAGLNFKERFMHDSLSFYWMMENWLYESTAYYDSFLEVLRTVDELLGEKELACADDLSLRTRAAKLIARQKKLNLKLREGRFIDKFNNTTKKDIKIKLIKIYVRAAHLARKLAWLLLPRKTRKTSNPVLFISTDDWRRIGEKNLDPNIYPIAAKLKTRNFLTLETIFSYQPDSIKNLAEKLKDVFMNFSIIESYDSAGIRKTADDEYREFRRRYAKLKKDREFQSSFEYKGIKIWPLIEPQLSCYFNTRLENHLWDYELLKKVISKEKPCVAVIGDETRELGKQLFHLCSKRGIPTVAVQHGSFENTIRVTHKKSELEGKTSCPLPTITCVYGKKDKEYLASKGLYPESRVVVTGSQRHDFLVNNSYDRQKICKELGLNPGRKIVVFATQPLPETEKRKLTEAACKAAKKLGLQLIIKVHPNELDDATYRKISEQVNAKAVVIKDYDSYKAIFASEIVITAYSTIGLEAMIMGKPLITGNFSGEKQRWADYAEKGAAIEAKTENEMSSAINNILTKKETRKKLEKSVKNYIYEHAFKADGKAAERIAKIIMELCK